MTWLFWTRRIPQSYEMKILITACACTPFAGSENYVGWSVVQCLAKHHELWVITSGRNQSDIERATAEGMVLPNVTFAYSHRPGPWHSNAMLARLQSWNEYRKFTKAALILGRELHQSVKFDLVHHVTITTWRIGLPFWRLGIPFVWGPIGGGEQFPFKLYSILSRSSKIFELVRSMSNVVSTYSPAVRNCARHAAHITAANDETKQRLLKLRRKESGVSVLSQAFYSRARIDGYSAPESQRKLSGPLRFFAGGMVEGRKGVALAFAALARLKRQGLEFSYCVGGIGPELRHLHGLVEYFGLRENVVFGIWKGTDYANQLASSHIYLLPSLRESTGLTMMEAMLAGCVPIIADCGGPALIVTETCGWKIPVGNAAAMIDGLAAAIDAADKDRSILQRKGAEARKRIATGYSEDAYYEAIDDIYRNVTNHRVGGERVQSL